MSYSNSSVTESNYQVQWALCTIRFIQKLTLALWLLDIRRYMNFFLPVVILLSRKSNKKKKWTTENEEIWLCNGSQ